MGWLRSLRLMVPLGGLVVGLVVLGPAMATGLVAAAIADAAWIRPFLYRDANRIFFPNLASSRFLEGTARLPEAFVWPWRDALGSANVAAYSPDWVYADLGASSRYVPAVRMTAGLTALTGVQPALGRSFTRDDETDGVILSHTAWTTHYAAAPSVLGRSLSVNGVPLTIVGVMPPEFVLPGTVRPSIFLARTVPVTPTPDFEQNLVRVLFRSDLPADALRQRSEAAIADALSRLDTTETGRLRLTVSPVASGGPAVAGATMFYAMIASIALVAFLSFAYSRAAHVDRSSRAFACHLAMGATWRRIVGMVAGWVLSPLAVSFVLAFVAAALFVERFGLDLELSLGLARRPELAWPTAAAVFLLALLAGISLTWLLVLRLWRHLRVPTILNGVHTATLPLRGQRLVLGGQSLCASALVTLASATAGLFVLLAAVNLGFDPANVLVAVARVGTEDPVDAQVTFDRIKGEIAGLPGVTRVSLADMPPMLGLPDYASVVVAGVSTRARVRRVDESYFSTLAIRTQHGRTFTAEDMTPSPSAAVVSATFAARALSSRPLGQPIVVERASLQVVGVVDDVRDIQVDRPAEPTIYVPNSDRGHRRFTLRGIIVRVAPGSLDVREEVERIIAPWKLKMSILPEPVTTLESRMDAVLVKPATYAAFTGLFALIALALATAGTYAVGAHVAARRTFEAAVRTACGAGRRTVTWELVRFAVWPVAIGLVGGTVGGVLLAQTVAEFVFTESPLSPWFTVAGAGLLGAGSVLSAVIPAWRAASVDPVVLLKTS